MVNTKRLITPIISIGVGFLTFMFMIMNYFAADLVGDAGSSGYESIGDFFDLGDYSGFIDGTFFTTMAAILLIFLIIMAVVLIVIGLLGFAKEFANFDLFADSNKLSLIAKLALKIYLIIDAVAAVFYIIFCMINDSFIPGLGVWFLIALGISGVVLNNVLTTKYASEVASANGAAISYKCSSCGASAKAGSKFCSKCGSAVIAVRGAGARKCPSCGATVKAGDKFCGSCGSAINS